jgi:DNA-binding NarL/FixJ family response regulator
MTAVAELSAQIANRRTGGARGPSRPIRLLVVDDHPAVRRTLRSLLEEQPDFEVRAVAEGAEAAISLARNVRFDVAVVDYQLGAARNGLWLCGELKRLSDPPRVLIYSAYCDSLLAAASIVARADGILSKGGLGRQLYRAIRGVTRERLHLPIAPRQLEDTIRGRLTEEEQIVFAMLLDARPLDEIAAVLECTRASLDVRLSRMLSTLEDVSARREATDRLPRAG